MKAKKNEVEMPRMRISHTKKGKKSYRAKRRLRKLLKCIRKSIGKLAWKTINWDKTERMVRKLQRRIAKAAKQKIRKKEKVIMNNYYFFPITYYLIKWQYAG